MEEPQTFEPTQAFRNIPWAYLGPVVAAPIPHVFVSLMTRYPQHKVKMFQAVVLTTGLAVLTRLILMNDAGYPGKEGQKRLPK